MPFSNSKQYNRLWVLHLEGHQLVPFGTKLMELFHARDIAQFCFINKLKTDQVKLRHIVTCYSRESKEDFTLGWMRKKYHGLLRYMRNHYLYGNIPKKSVLLQSKNGFNFFCDEIKPLYSLREMCPNSELFLVRIFLYSDWIRRFTLIRNTESFRAVIL